MKTSFYGVFLSFCPPFNSCNMTRSSQYLTSPHILSQRAGPNSLFIFIRMFRIILTENYPNQITIINIAITLMIANVCAPSTRYLWTTIWLRTQVQLMGVKQVTHYPVGIVQSHLTSPNQKQYISRWYSSNLPRNMRAWQWIKWGAKESRQKKERVIVVFQLGWEFANKRFKTKHWPK